MLRLLLAPVGLLLLAVALGLSLLGAAVDALTGVKAFVSDMRHLFAGEG